MSSRCRVDDVLAAAACAAAGAVIPCGILVGEGRVDGVSGVVGGASGITGQGLSGLGAAGPTGGGIGVRASSETVGLAARSGGARAATATHLQ